MKKRLMLVVCAVLFVFASEAKAWRPSGWCWFQWPYAYSLRDSGWYYLNQSDTQWCYDFQISQWLRLGQAPMANGWNYFQWPYAYSLNSGNWNYLNEADIQWCYSYNNQAWSKLGVVVGSPTAIAMNNSIIDTCAEHDGVNVPLVGDVTNFWVTATHPMYVVTNYGFGTDFSNCPNDDTNVNYSFSFYTQKTDFSGGYFISTRELLWWLPQGMTVTINGQFPVTNAHNIQIGKQIPGTTEWPIYFVMYSDGNMRLIPFPPAGQASVCFGSSVIIGAAVVENRPHADIATLDFRPPNTIFITYRNGGTALLDLSVVTRTNAIVKVNVNYPTDEPFTTLRSMYVADGNSDCDYVWWKTFEGVTNSSPILSFAGDEAKEFFFYRQYISKHNQSSADIRINIK